MKLKNVLIIEDHPQITESYKLALQKIANDSNTYNFKIEETSTIDNALKILNKQGENFYDIIFLDIKLPKSSDGKFLSGEDLGIYIKKKSSNSKIMISTTFNDNHRINNIFKSINPEGFLIKNDLKPKALVNAIEELLEGIPAYSKTVKVLLRKFATNDISIDSIDRQILYYLSIGVKMSDLPKFIPMSMSGIERRKRQLKESFNLSKANDKQLVEKAKEKGFI